jgi:hypothetical protein
MRGACGNADHDADLELDVLGIGRVALDYAPPNVAQGWVLVHYDGRPDDIYTVWLQERVTPGLVQCDCGWQPTLGPHYRLNLTQAIEHYRGLGLL